MRLWEELSSGATEVCYYECLFPHRQIPSNPNHIGRIPGSEGLPLLANSGPDPPHDPSPRGRYQSILTSLTHWVSLIS